MEALNSQGPTQQPGLAGPYHGKEPEKSAAWEKIAEGRYRPRRIRGSLLGRELG